MINNGNINSNRTIQYLTRHTRFFIYIILPVSVDQGCFISSFHQEKTGLKEKDDYYF
ncbi:hypothetical protein BCV71DRAFT_228629 [Rhizopus microsporus]|uniref:Uncharacterized protein n=1 Tax=Rhizopus microsporus TaxID=58291 RepID=A0A1X0RUL8_RHIZD|nr:hypothetical protein BCV71DRAFT_228629 [Rhizopus microsporus]